MKLIPHIKKKRKNRILGYYQAGRGGRKKLNPDIYSSCPGLVGEYGSEDVSFAHARDFPELALGAGYRVGFGFA